MSAGRSQTLLLVRHAEATVNLLEPDAPFTGLPDGAPLTPAGVRQAAALAESLPGALVPFALYTSPARRAVDTAAPIARRFARRPRRDRRLAEVRVSARWDPPFSVRIWDELLAARIAAPDREPLSGIETLSAQSGRVGAFLDDLLAARPTRNAVVVAHALTIEVALLHLLGLPLGQLRLFRFKSSNTGAFLLDRAGPEHPWRLVVANSKAHLGAIC